MSVMTDPILDILGLINLSYSIYCLSIVIQNEHREERDVLGAHILFFAGCINLTAAYLRCGDLAPFEMAFTAGLFATGFINIATAYFLVKSPDGPCMDGYTLLPLYHDLWHPLDEEAISDAVLVVVGSGEVLGSGDLDVKKLVFEGLD